MQTQDVFGGFGSRFGASKFGTDNTGFSHGAYNSNHGTYPGLGDRNLRKPTIPSIATATKDQQHMYNANEQTPGTAFDMSFTPLLPSQLLLGSPFQPGSPGAFASPQFPSFNRFPQGTNALHHQTQQYQQNQQAQLASPAQSNANPLSPQAYQLCHQKPTQPSRQQDFRV